MSNKRYAIMFFRSGLLASAIIAVFLNFWRISGHEVSNSISLKITSGISWNFPLSEWWYVIFAFLIINTCAWILRVYYKMSLKFINNTDYSFIVFIFGLSLVSGFGFSNMAIIIFNYTSNPNALGLIVDFITIGLAISGFILIVAAIFLSDFYKSIYSWLSAKNIS